MLNKSSSVQLSIFEETQEAELGTNHQRSRNCKMNTYSTFSDNMSLPIHRWFRYSAGFSALWVSELIEQETPEKRVVMRFLLAHRKRMFPAY